VLLGHLASIICLENNLNSFGGMNEIFVFGISIWLPNEKAV